MPRQVKEVVGLQSYSAEMLLKHPYSARARENAGRNSIVVLNAKGTLAFLRDTIIGRPAQNGSLFLAFQHPPTIAPTSTLDAASATAGALRVVGIPQPQNSKMLSGPSLRRMRRGGFCIFSASEWPSRAGMNSIAITPFGASLLRDASILAAALDSMLFTVEGQARLGTIPTDEFIDGVPNRLLRTRRCERIQNCVL